MKNPAIEAMKRRAKLYHRNKVGDTFTHGIIVRHLYYDMTPEHLSFWDDAAFIVNDYRVALWWTHPRHRYHDLVEEEAMRRLAHLRPQSDPFGEATPNYKKVGRSRKKIVSWTQRPTSDEYRRYFDLLTDMERQVSQDTSFDVRPSMAVSWYSWCKGLSLCAPFEVRSEADLLALTRIARRLVRRESTLADEFGDRVYRRADWLSDCKTLAEQNRSPMFSHAVKLSNALPVFEPDDGSLTENQVAALRKDAEELLPRGNLIESQDLFEPGQSEQDS
jgi:hypothetical protein